MKIGFKTLQTEVSWETLVEVWKFGDSMDVFQSGWLNDHFVAWRKQGGYLEAWTTATALASQTSRLTIGHTVLSNTYRHPGLLAKMASTLDHISHGRFVLGLGAGWNEQDHAMFGWPLPPIGTRMDMLEESISMIKGMWRHPEGYTFSGAHYQAVDAITRPPCFTAGGPRIWLGTRGRQRGLRILAQFADGWAFSSDGWTPRDPGSLAEFLNLKDVLFKYLEEEGRDPSSVEISARIAVEDKRPTDLIQEAQAWLRSGASHIVFAVQAAHGPGSLERLADSVVRPLLSVGGP